MKRPAAVGVFSIRLDQSLWPVLTRTWDVYGGIVFERGRLWSIFSRGIGAQAHVEGGHFGMTSRRWNEVLLNVLRSERAGWRRSSIERRMGDRGGFVMKEKRRYTKNTNGRKMGSSIARREEWPAPSRFYVYQNCDCGWNSNEMRNETDEPILRLYRGLSCSEKYSRRI